MNHSMDFDPIVIRERNHQLHRGRLDLSARFLKLG